VGKSKPVEIELPLELLLWESGDGGWYKSGKPSRFINRAKVDWFCCRIQRTNTRYPGDSSAAHFSRDFFYLQGPAYTRTDEKKIRQNFHKKHENFQKNISMSSEVSLRTDFTSVVLIQQHPFYRKFCQKSIFSSKIETCAKSELFANNLNFGSKMKSLAKNWKFKHWNQKVFVRTFFVEKSCFNASKFGWKLLYLQCNFYTFLFYNSSKTYQLLWARLPLFPMLGRCTW